MFCWTNGFVAIQPKVVHVEKTENYEICLEVSGEVSDVSIIPSSWSDNSLVRVNQGDKTKSRYNKQNRPIQDWRRSFGKSFFLPQKLYFCNTEAMLKRSVGTVKCERWWQRESVSPDLKLLLFSCSRLQTVFVHVAKCIFVQISECICINWWMYLYKMLNVFVSNGNNAKVWVRPR